MYVIYRCETTAIFFCIALVRCEIFIHDLTYLLTLQNQRSSPFQVFFFLFIHSLISLWSNNIYIPFADSRSHPNAIFFIIGLILTSISIHYDILYIHSNQVCLRTFVRDCTCIYSPPCISTCPGCLYNPFLNCLLLHPASSPSTWTYINKSHLRTSSYPLLKKFFFETLTLSLCFLLNFLQSTLRCVFTLSTKKYICNISTT